MHQSIPPVPSPPPPPPPPGWPPGISFCFALDGKFPRVGTLELSNPPGWGRKKRADPSSVSTATFFIDRTVEWCHFKHFQVRFFVSINVFLCNNATILIKTSRRDGIDWCITKSTSPQLLRSQDLDQISCLTWSGNDQQYKSLLAQLRSNQNLYQPLLFLISSNKSVLKDFTNFARKMSLRYMFEDKRKILAHPFHVKSTWQPPIQNSVALQRYLEETKLELASTVFHAPLDYISANERKAIGSLKRNSEINL